MKLLLGRLKITKTTLIFRQFFGKFFFYLFRFDSVDFFGPILVNFYSQIHHLETLIPIVVEAQCKGLQNSISKLGFMLCFFTKQSIQTALIHNQYLRWLLLYLTHREQDYGFYL